MFGALKKRFTDNLDSVLGKYASDKNLLEAAMAACAMMAAADGEIEPKEKAKTADFIRKHESMRHFDQQEASRLFTRYADGFDLDFDMGADECLKQIGDIKDPDKANLVARVAMMVVTPSPPTVARPLFTSFHW